MKKIIKIALLSLTFLFLIPQKVSAHNLQSDGSIGAVLHVDPEDDPIVGSQSSLFFEFKDKNNQFKPQTCDCSFLITKEEKEVFRQDLFANSDGSLESASVSFTFPEKGVYKIIVTGSPKVAGAFQPFTLKYDLRVAREEELSDNSKGADNKTYSPWIYASLFLISIFIVGVFLSKKRESSKS